jgi:hypothetical protein
MLTSLQFIFHESDIFTGQTSITIISVAMKIKVKQTVTLYTGIP